TFCPNRLPAKSGRCRPSVGRSPGFPSRGLESLLDSTEKPQGILPMLFDPAFVGSSPQDALEFIVGILQSSTDYSIIGKGLDGTILLWNEGARRLYGYEAGELLGKAKSDLLHTPEDVAVGRPREIMESALRHGKWEGVLSRVRKD